MTANYNQLRFDILEKVRLHPQKPGIGTLLELDLYPDVEIEDQGSHLKIEGYLRLNGTYLSGHGYLLPEEGEGEASSHPNGMISSPPPQKEEIAYVIPVEITLPAERADIDHIASEIESFDYKVLSPFELHIEAVLSIDGLLNDEQSEEPSADYELVDPESAEEPLLPAQAESQEDLEEAMDSPEAAEEAQEEVSFMDERRQEEDLSASDSSDMEASNHESETENYDFVHVARYDGIDDSHGVLHSQSFHDEESESPEDTVFQTHETPIAEASPDVEEEVTSEMEATRATEAESEFEKEADPPPLFSHDRRGWGDNRYLRHPHHGEFDFQELDTDERQKFGIEHLSEMAQNEEATKGQQFLEERQASDEPPSATETNQSDEKNEGKPARLDWARWILGDEEEEFVKVRMVIVQKEDSLDTIAERYEVSASKILHLNQLESNVLEQGQIVYIPRS
ncbi:LysM peptidoglycan-binding domain-containing protein [Marininema halotolerans]|uniref:Stage VI sporulation protein D n=1 Tax=Marininema halotolerans TaxID=1155944 RepID=A0A1I6U2L7_9BACL|nr:LysM peptidoglycan-binding domain-containing protein [Marininema halotolerans]SFS95716.1 stage VI sporulation protein D [Marininema halotolerans]